MRQRNWDFPIKSWIKLALFPAIGLASIAMFQLASLASAQDYPNSVASTDFDYIQAQDQSVFEKLEYIGERKSEMPDKRFDDRELMQPSFVFAASFTDGTRVQIAIDSAFLTKPAAETEAMRYVHRLGKLPTTLRAGVQRLVVHKGGRDTTAFSDVGLIVVYSENATKRISTHDLEETIFHESVHASWDKKHANSEAWRKAQASDNTFVTSYAKRNPRGEDLAESALFAYTLIHHPGRIPRSDAEKIKKSIPSRIRFVAELIPPNKPIFYEVTPDENDANEPDESNTVDTRSRKCRVDVLKAGQLHDVLSNILMIRFKIDEPEVQAFFTKARANVKTGEELFRMTLSEFKLDEGSLKTEIREFLHCNCDHAADPNADKRLVKILAEWKPTNGASPKKQ